MQRPKSKGWNLEARRHRPKLTFRQIDVFRAVMITGSLSAAARQLNISQPSLGRLVKRTEDLVGFALFDRAKGRLLPTAEARLLFASVQHIQEQLDGLGDVILRIGQEGPGRFQLGASPSLARRLVPAALARFREWFPGVPIHFDTVTLPNVVDYLALGRGECFLSIAPIDHPVVESRAIWPGRLVCLLPPDHPLCARPKIAVADLVNLPLIAFEPDTPHGRMVEDAFAEIRRRPTANVVVKVAWTAIGLAAERLGIAILDEFTAMEAAPDRLAVRPVDLPPRFSIHINRNRQAAHSRFTGALEAALLEVLRSRETAADPAGPPVPSGHRARKPPHWILSDRARISSEEEHAHRRRKRCRDPTGSDKLGL
jgi:DNA-binding transcriptional LysR family regulator